MPARRGLLRLEAQTPCLSSPPIFCAVPSNVLRPPERHAGQSRIELADFGDWQRLNSKALFRQQLRRAREMRADEHLIVDAQRVGSGFFAIGRYEDFET